MLLVCYYAVMVRRFSLALLMVFFSATAALCAGKPIYAFEDFPAESVFQGKPAVPVLKRDLKRFKTVIRQQAASGPNFAGAYTIVTWGCGSNCQHSVLIDAKKGTAYVLGVTELGLEYRKDSRLLVLNPDTEIPLEETVFTDSKPRYLVWDGKTMHDIARERAVKLPPSDAK